MQSQESTSESSTIKTRRLILRPMTKDDGEAAYILRSNPKILYWRSPDTRAQSDQWLHDRLADPMTLNYCVALTPALEHTCDHPVIGMVGGVRLPEIGYMYDPSVWGNGYATEALQGWIDMYRRRWPEGHPNIKDEKERCILTAVTGPDDISSKNVLAKCGFGFVGKKEVEEDGNKVLLNRWRLGTLGG